MTMPGRSYTSENYRFGFNGMEKDDEVSGDGNQYTTEFRQYDPRLGRWTSLDPLMAQFPHMSPYVAYDNNPVLYTDVYGLSPSSSTKKDDPTNQIYASGRNEQKTVMEDLVGFDLDDYSFQAEKTEGMKNTEININVFDRDGNSVGTIKYASSKYFEGIRDKQDISQDLLKYAFQNSTQMQPVFPNTSNIPFFSSPKGKSNVEMRTIWEGMSSGIAFVNVNDGTPIGGMINAFLGGAGGSYFKEQQEHIMFAYYNEYKQLKKSIVKFFQGSEQLPLILSPEARNIMEMSDKEMFDSANEKAKEIIYKQIGKYKSRKEADWWIFGGQN
ncbi:MAG: hypothetical protein H6578_11900 [Chitinophagales bacterium]|nr:hypothetical protein [Chitinophagales bacterium]